MPGSVYQSDLNNNPDGQPIPNWTNQPGYGILRTYAASGQGVGITPPNTKLFGSNSNGDLAHYNVGSPLVNQGVRITQRFPTLVASAMRVINPRVRCDGYSDSGGYYCLISSDGTFLTVRVLQRYVDFIGSTVTTNISPAPTEDYFCEMYANDVTQPAPGCKIDVYIYKKGTARPANPTWTYTQLSTAPAFRTSGDVTLAYSSETFGFHGCCDVEVTDGSLATFGDPVPDTTAPVMQGVLSLSAIGQNGGTVSWQAATDAVGVTDYEGSIDNGVNYASWGLVLTKALSGLTPATGYAIKVRAVDGANNKSSPLSITLTTSAPPDTVAPAMQGVLTSSNITSGGYRLNYQAATDAVGVTGYEHSFDNVTYVDIGNNLYYDVTGRIGSTQYTNYVRSRDAANNKSSPLTLNVTTAASADTTAPTISGSITLSNITDTSATIACPAGADNVAVAGYEYSKDGGSTWVNTNAARTANLAGLTSGTAYPIRWRCYDAAGLRSNELQATLTTTGAVNVVITQALKNIHGSPRANVAVHALIKNLITKVTLVNKTGLTTDANGVPSAFQIGGLSAATKYAVEVINDADPEDIFVATVTTS